VHTSVTTAGSRAFQSDFRLEKFAPLEVAVRFFHEIVNPFDLCQMLPLTLGQHCQHFPCPLALFASGHPFEEPDYLLLCMHHMFEGVTVVIQCLDLVMIEEQLAQAELVAVDPVEQYGIHVRLPGRQDLFQPCQMPFLGIGQQAVQFSQFRIFCFAAECFVKVEAVPFKFCHEFEYVHDHHPPFLIRL